MKSFHPKTPPLCPPDNAKHPNGIFFRVVLNNPPIPRDFVIWIEEPYNKHRLDEVTKQGKCQAFAASMFADEAATLRKIDLFRRAWKEKSRLHGTGFLGIAQVKLDATSGVIKQTGADKSHYDLWPYVGCQLDRNVISVKVA